MSTKWTFVRVAYERDAWQQDFCRIKAVFCCTLHVDQDAFALLSGLVYIGKCCDDAVDRAVMMLHDAPPLLNICYIKYRGGAALCQMGISPCPKAFLMI